MGDSNLKGECKYSKILTENASIQDFELQLHLP